MSPRLLALIPLLLLSAPPARSDVRASLPLQGYTRPGSFMPVRLEGTTRSTEIEIAGDGVAPTRVAVSGGAVNVIVPVLAVGSTNGMVLRELDGGKTTPIQPAANERENGGLPSRRPLIGIATRQPVRHTLAAAETVQLDPADPVPGPALAWEALDHLVTEPATAARIGDAKLLDLLSGGVTILRVGEPPSGTLPWVRGSEILPGRADVWTLSADLRGPRGSVFEHALRPVAGAEAGLSHASRRNVLLAAALFTIVATCSALLLPPRRSVLILAVMGMVVLLTVGAVHAWWTRRPAPPTGSGWVIIEQPPFTQVDTWIYYGPPRGTLNLPAMLRPITESIDALSRLRPTLRCAADGTPVGFSCDLPAQTLAVLARDLVLNEAPVANVDVTVTSPLLPMVKLGYLQPGRRRYAVAGQAPSESWPSVVVRPVLEPVRGPTTGASR